jgi:hypothetical protein
LVRVGSGQIGVLPIAAELRDECLNQEIFYSLKEAQVVIGQSTLCGRMQQNRFSELSFHRLRRTTLWHAMPGAGCAHRIISDYSSLSEGFDRAHIHGTPMPVEEPSTESIIRPQRTDDASLL